MHAGNGYSCGIYNVCLVYNVCILRLHMICSKRCSKHKVHCTYVTGTFKLYVHVHTDCKFIIFHSVSGPIPLHIDILTFYCASSVCVYYEVERRACLLVPVWCCDHHYILDYGGLHALCFHCQDFDYVIVYR